MEWNNELCLQLIDEYEKWPILWKAKHPCHFSRNQKVDAWETIAANLKIDMGDIKQKMNSLLGSLRREKSKGKKTIGTGKATTEVYISKWYAFKRMHFLLDKDEPVATLDTEMTEHEDHNSEILTLQGNTVENSNGIHENHTQDIQESQNESMEEVISATCQRFDSTLDVPKQKKRKPNKNDDAKLDEAFNILKQSLAVPPTDECFTYGAYVGNKIRNYTQQVRVQVEHAINNILYDADTGRYDNPSPINAITPGTNFLAGHSNIRPPLPSPSVSDASSASGYYPSSATPAPVGHSYNMPDLDFTDL